nr:PREDICTED: ras-related protein Rab-24 [Struthio camelus australis]
MSSALLCGGWRVGCRGGSWGKAEPDFPLPDLTDSSSFQRAKFWVNELQNFEENCRIYLCGTKSDLLEEDRRKRGVDFHDVQDYADEIKAELFETSSKTGQSVDELFQKVAEDFVHFTAFQVMTEEKGVDLGQKSGTYLYSCCHH